MDATEQDYELLSQYLDQELPPAAAQALARRLADEPQLKARLDGMKALQKRMQEAFGAIDAQSVPARIEALLQPAPTRIVQLPHKRLMNWGFALAASLVVAVSATLLTRQVADIPRGGADALLAAVLERSPSRGAGWEMLADGRRVMPVLSFQSKTGGWCREYLLAGDGGNWHGVACRGEAGWTNSVLTAADGVNSATEYRPAAAADSDTVARYIDQNAAGIPLGSKQEAELIARGWQ